MTGSNPLKGKQERNDEVTQDDSLEGTSARTRPFSFHDIMLARKNKADVTKQINSGPGATDIASVQDEKNSSSEFHKQNNEDSGSKYTIHTLEDSQKLNSLGKGDTSASRETKRLVPDNKKESREHYPKLKSVVDTNINNNRVKEIKNERRHQYNKEKHAGEKDGFLSDRSDNGSDRRQSRGSVKKEKGSETSRGKSEIDRKQLHNEDRQVSRKRKSNGRMTSDSEYRKRNERDTMLTDRLTDRGREKSSKEARDKHHNEEDRTRGRNPGEKHGSEKKGVDSIRAYHGESRSKRRRSQSRERAKERGRKPLSQSPKPPKHRSRDKGEHGEPLSNSTKDRSSKENSDADKRISSNGSSNQYRRNNASLSGLGGYSPRKRKTDAAAKTPSPTRRSPARRTAGWDLQPVEKEISHAGSTFADVFSSQNLSINIQESASGPPVIPIVMKPIGISPHSLSSQMHAIESIQLTQATRPMRRLYVENLPASASEKDLIACINKFLLSSGVNYVQGTQPCISCIIHKEKGQALLEFLTPEDASAALSFDGISFSGSNLKLRRPKDYATISTGVPDKSVVAVDSVSDNVEDSPHKIFIGGISKFITSKMLLEIARVFGPVKAFRYEYIADISEPCAFLEYVDHSVTSKACASLNGMRLGGKVVSAVFATPDAIMEDVGKRPFYGVPEHAKPLLQKPSAVLELKNVLDPQNLLSLSESELEEILEDIRIECSRFGTVKSVNVAKPTNPSGTKEDETETTTPSFDGCNLASENRRSETEKLGESINEVAAIDQSGPMETVEDNSGCDDCIGVSNMSTEPEDEDMSKGVGGSLPDEINADNIAKDEMTKLAPDDANVSVKDHSGQETTHGTAEFASLKISPVNEPEKIDDATASISPRNTEMEEKDSSEQELKLENNTKDESSIELDTSKRRSLASSEAVDEKDAPNDLGNIFEPGCIFVEYRRAEAACMAAHCLHGRLFDGRVVTVGYVNPNLYQMRFRK